MGVRDQTKTKTKTKTKAKRGRPPDRPDRRESIMAAALGCLVERGFYGTAMPLIADKAGVAAGTIYHYFDSKETLVNALYRSWKTVVAQRVFTAFPQEAPVREQFRVMWHEMIAFAMEEPEAFVFIELHNHASYLDDESRAVDRTLKDFTRGVIQFAQGQGLLKPLDASVLMELVFGAFVGMMRAHVEARIALSPEIIAKAEEACWDAVALREGARSVSDG
jgi:TetR/AcrR family transcriptional regulator, repressor of fatR-cypB operon